MWRPKNWKKQEAISADIDKCPHKTWDVAHSCGWRDGYEAGADAMLEALRNREYITIKYVINRADIDKNIKWYSIPDDEEAE